MPELPFDSALLYPLAVGGVALLVVVWFGWHRPAALDGAPARATALVPADVLIGLGLMYACMALASALAQELVGGGAEPSALQSGQRAMIGQLVGQGLPVVYLIVRLSSQRGWVRAFGLWPRRLWRDLGVSALGIVLGIALTFGTLALVQILMASWGLPLPEEPGHDMLIQMRDSDSQLALVMMLVSAIVLAPVLEELIFRGLVQSALVSHFAPALGAHGRLLIVGIAALIFMAIHVGPGVAMYALPALFVLGVVLGWLYERTGSLWPPILLHMAFNGLNVSWVLFVLEA